jgi:hypothetical protein
MDEAKHLDMQVMMIFKRKLGETIQIAEDWNGQSCFRVEKAMSTCRSCMNNENFLIAVETHVRC